MQSTRPLHVSAPLLALAFVLSCAGERQTLGFSSEAGAPPDADAADAGGPTTFGPPDADVVSAACTAAANNKSAVGCDFSTLSPDVFNNAVGGCFAVFISNGGQSDVRITLDFAGTPITNFGDFARIPLGTGRSIEYLPLDGGNVLHSKQVAILFLAGTFEPESVQCPTGVTPAYAQGDAALHGTGIGKSFRIRTDNPVTAYDVYPFGGGISAYSAASLLIPRSSWDTSYVAIDAYAKSNPGQPWIAVIAAEDGTEVTLKPTANVVGGGGLASVAAGGARTYMIDRGQVLQFTQDAELVGSPIESTKPVALFGGATCMTIPTEDVYACDTGHQQIPPVHALGHQYAYARYRDRYTGVVESPPVRLVGAVDGTQLTYDPAPPPGAPLTLSSRQMVQFATSDAFTVRSQDDDHPFYMSAYMTGCTAYLPKDLDDCRGDPEFVNVVPPQEFANEYVFFTDPTYPETELVVVRQKGKDGFADVHLDCLDANVGGWTDMGKEGQYQFTRVDLVTGNFEKKGNCDNGQHTMTSDGPFGVTVWGWGSAATGGENTGAVPTNGFSQWVSYAYAAGMSLVPLNSIVLK